MRYVEPDFATRERYDDGGFSGGLGASSRTHVRRICIIDFMIGPEMPFAWKSALRSGFTDADIGKLPMQGDLRSLTLKYRSCCRQAEPMFTKCASDRQNHIEL